jgi:ParB/RepB/Spo0J family partition protein
LSQTQGEWWIRVDQVEEDEAGELRQDDGDLDALATSIQKHGLINPIILFVGPSGEYKVRAGRRRLRALKKLGRDRLRVGEDVKLLPPGMDEKAALLLGIAENVDRKDLTPIEEAAAYRRIVNLGLTQQEIADLRGVSRPAVANRLRLLTLPEPIQEMIKQDKLKPGHAEHALLPLNKYPEHQKRLARDIAEGRYDFHEAARVANSIIEEENMLQKWRDAVDASAHKKCPTCGGDPRQPYGRWEPPMVECEKSHRWDLDTGKVKLYSWQKAELRAKNGKEKKPPQVLRSTVPVELVGKVMTARCRRLPSYTMVCSPNVTVDFNRWGRSVDRMSIRYTQEGYKGYGVGGEGFSVTLEKKQYKDAEKHCTKIDLAASEPKTIRKMTRVVEEWLRGVEAEAAALEGLEKQGATIVEQAEILQATAR